MRGIFNSCLFLYPGILFFMSCRFQEIKNTVPLITKGPARESAVSEELLREVRKANNLPGIEDFYLVFNKAKLGTPYLIGGYFSNSSYPIFDLVPLVTRIVRFELRGKKLFMINITPGRRFIAITEPVDLLDAFPVIKETDKMIIVDFASGENQFSFSPFADFPISIIPPDKQLRKQLSMLNNLREENGYIVFDNILSLYSETPIWMPDTNYPFSGDIFNLNVRLTYFLKEYVENKPFKPTKPWDHVGYFLTDPQFLRERNESGNLNENITQYIIKWDISREHQTWYYSPGWPEKYIPALKHAINQWNRALKKDFFVLKRAPAEMSPDQPDKNYIYWSESSTLAMATAYATATYVPTTGEILSSKIVFFGTNYLSFLKRFYDSRSFTIPENNNSNENPNNLSNNMYLKLDEVAEKIGRAKHEGFSHPALSIGNWRTRFLCIRTESEIKRYLTETIDADIKRLPISFDDFALRMIKSTIVHEMGHSLGLRHNFKGSLVADFPGEPERPNQQTSVMEYLPPTHSYMATDIGTYDYAAIDFGYFDIRQENVPEYCTDEDVGKDPNCLRWDAGDPYLYSLTMVQRLLNSPPFLMQATLEDLINYFNPLVTFISAQSNRSADALDFFKAFLPMNPENTDPYPAYINLQLSSIKFFLTALFFTEKSVVSVLKEQDILDIYTLFKEIAIDAGNWEKTLIRLVAITGFKKAQTDYGYRFLRETDRSLSKKIEKEPCDSSPEDQYWRDYAILDKTRDYLQPYY